jgi:hypothetical protein
MLADPWAMVLRIAFLAILANTCAAIHVKANEKDSMMHASRVGGNNSTPFESGSLGDLTCMRNTGGSCVMFSCNTDRGPTVCEQGKCLCSQGLCANAEGVCDQQGKGKWLGSHSIAFNHPYDQQKPFIGVTEGGPWLSSSSSSQPAWKIALSPGGRVRLESLLLPGTALKIYNNRRRRTDDEEASRRRRRKYFLLAKKTATSKRAANVTDGVAETLTTHTKKAVLPDNDDLWPMVTPIEEASPIDVTFQVRPTHKNGGGLEIWDPQTGHVLASGNPEWYSKDQVAAQGIAECSDWGMFSAGDCEGRQLVQFEPELPFEATPFVSRADITAIAVLSWWQVPLLFLSIVGCYFCGVAGCRAGRILLSDEEDEAEATSVPSAVPPANQ